VIELPQFDWVHPAYAPIWQQRIKRLAKIESDPKYLQACRMYYRTHLADFINDWGVTVDPRNVGSDIPVIMPFVLFPRQREFIDFIFYDCWKPQQDGTAVKSRDCGASWLVMAISCSLGCFWDDVAIGFGSSVEDKVDRSGDPDSLFYKGRMFLRYLPAVFRAGWDANKNSAHMRLTFPDTGSSITGEAGDRIGRSGRKTIFFIDEAAFLEHPKLVDANLIANTDCRFELSSVQGTANVFAERARGGKVKRFDFHYRFDPRKVNQDSGELLPKFKDKRDKADPVIWASEFECDFLASVEGILIPQEWVVAAIGAAQKLGIKVSGVRKASYDVADRGKDKNAFCVRHGIEVSHIEQWSGKGSDIMLSLTRVFGLCDEYDCAELVYDGDGMGAAVRGDARDLNETRVKAGKREIDAQMFRGSGKVLDPERKTPGTDRKNIDYLENQKAQSYMALRMRFLETFRAINGEPYDASEIISLNPKLKELTALCSELSQPVRCWSKAGKLMIDKTPDDVRSPNLSDCVMQAYSYQRSMISINPEALQAFNHDFNFHPTP
jgi:phage terminase large subunit